MEHSPQESGNGNNICIYSLLTAQAKPPVKILKLGFNVMVCVCKRETKSHHKPHVLRSGWVCVNITVNHQGRPEPLLAGQRINSWDKKHFRAVPLQSSRAARGERGSRTGVNGSKCRKFIILLKKFYFIEVSILNKPQQINISLMLAPSKSGTSRIL